MSQHTGLVDMFGHTLVNSSGALRPRATGDAGLFYRQKGCQFGYYTAMEQRLPHIVSIEGILALLVAVFLAIADINWIVRISLVVIGVGLIVFLAWRLSVEKWLRIVGALAACAMLIGLSVRPILSDYSKSHPPDIQLQQMQ